MARAYVQIRAAGRLSKTRVVMPAVAVDLGDALAHGAAPRTHAQGRTDSCGSSWRGHATTRRGGGKPDKRARPHPDLRYPPCVPRVLLVDDSASVRTLIAQKLRALTYEVEEYPDQGHLRAPPSAC